MWRFLNNSNTANDAMTTVKRFIDRLGTQKSRSCQKSTKPAIHLRTLNEAQNQSKLPRSTFCGSHTVCEIHTYLFYLLTQKQQRGKDLYFLWREFGSERSRLITSQFLFDFLRKTAFPLLFLPAHLQQSSNISNLLQLLPNPITNTGD